MSNEEGNKNAVAVENLDNINDVCENIWKPISVNQT